MTQQDMTETHTERQAYLKSGEGGRGRKEII